MRVAGEDEVVDAEVDVLASCARRPDPGRRPAPCRRRRAPGRRRPTGSGAIVELVPPAAMQARHAALADGVEAGEGLLRRGDRGVVEPRRSVRRRRARPRTSVSRTITCRRMPKRKRAPAPPPLPRAPPRSSRPRRRAARPRSGRRRRARPRPAMPASDEPPK